MDFLAAAWPYLLAGVALIGWLLRIARHDRVLYEHIRDRSFMPLAVTYALSLGALAASVENERLVANEMTLVWVALWVVAMFAVIVFGELDKIARLPPSDPPTEAPLSPQERTPSEAQSQEHD